MEFRFRAGEERGPSLRPPTSRPDGYSAPQPLSGFAGIGSEMGRAGLMHPAAAFGALRRELQKERIREEIIAREITERRILEEEVRREMAMECAMGIRRIPMAESLMLAPAPHDMVAERLLAPPVLHTPCFAFDEDSPLRVKPNAIVEEELALGHQKIDPKTVQPLSVVEAPLSGIKRKAVAAVGSGKLQQAFHQSWSCALCEVSATCEEGLKDHLQGKKHQAKLALLGPINGGASSTTVHSSEQGATPATDEAMRYDMEVSGKMHQVVRTKRYFMCEHCGVKGNSKVMMAGHLSGKKHAARVGELSGGDDDGKLAKGTTTNTDAVKDEQQQLLLLLPPPPKLVGEEE